MLHDVWLRAFVSKPGALFTLKLSNEMFLEIMPTEFPSLHVTAR